VGNADPLCTAQQQIGAIAGRIDSPGNAGRWQVSPSHCSTTI
jgi:hypothetical protein